MNHDIPAYTKVGVRITTIVLILLSFIILRNCMYSVKHGSTSNDAEIKSFYEKGYADGVKKGKGIEVAATELESDNLLLKKMYQKGYRQGWDSTRQSR